MRTFALFGAKTSDFSNFMVCPYGQVGRGNFSRFCEDVLNGRPFFSRFGHNVSKWSGREKQSVIMAAPEKISSLL